MRTRAQSRTPSVKGLVLTETKRLALSRLQALGARDKLSKERHMAKMNGCNSDLVDGPIGSRSTRTNPGRIQRNNLAMGGVNKHSGGSDVWGKKPALAAGKNGTGYHRHDSSKKTSNKYG